MVSGRSVTGVLNMWNKTVIDYYTKLQNTVEVATFGSEQLQQELSLNISSAYALLSPT